MARVVCPQCGEEHDFGEMEPRYARPDAFLEVPLDERAFRTLEGDSMCAVRPADDTERRFFLRVVMPMPVRGESRACNWGIWVEVSEESYYRMDALWDDPEQGKQLPFPGIIANALLGYDETVGLPGFVQLSDPLTVPTFRLDASLTHPLAVEQRGGVYPERVVEWQAWHAHE